MDDVIRAAGSEPIAIIGLSAAMPKAASVAEFWRNIVTGEDCLEDVPETRWRLSDYFSQEAGARDKTYGRRGGFLPDMDFDPVEFGMPPSVLDSTDPAQLFGLMLARAALADAGYPALSETDHHRTSVILGVAGTTMQRMSTLAARMEYPVIGAALQEAGVDAPTQAQVIRRFGENYPAWDENSFPGYLANLVPGRIANRFDLGAASYAVDAACASSLCAIRLACSELRSGQCDLAVTGGVDTDNSILAFTSFSKTRALSPSQQVRPYDAQGDGTMIAEGIGMLVLKRLSDAELAGDRIYAVIRAIGASTDGRGSAIYAPRADGQTRAIRSALAEAGVAASGIGLIEGHGTGTAVGDGVELESLLSVYGASVPPGRRVPIGSVKSQIGHTKAAAGAASLIKTALALHHKVLPPTLGVTQPATQIAGAGAPFGLMARAQPWFCDAGPRRAAVSAFGFGGANYHAVLEAYQGASAQAGAAPWPRSVLLKGADAAALAALCTDLAGRPGDLPALPETSGAVRLAFAARSAEQAARLLREAAEALTARPEARDWSLPSGLSYTSAPAAPGRVVAVFSGQGSQYVGMGAELAVDHPAFRAAIEAMDAALLGAGEAPVSAVMLPPAMLDQPPSEETAARLRSPLYAQAAVGAFAMGSLAVLRAQGLRPDMVLGHSFGELPALCAAGAIDADAYADLVVARGRSLSPPEGIDAGGLIAVQAPEAEVAALLPRMPGCGIANLNAPRQTVIGGATPALDAAEAVLAEAGLAAVRLPVAAGFHTAAVAYAEAPWQAALAGTEFAAPEVPVFANTTAAPYDPRAEAVRDTLAAQPFRPVRFREQIEAAYEAGGRIFLEIGPKGLMTRLVAETLGERPHVALSINPRPTGDASLQLHQAVAALKLIGVPLEEAPRPAAARPRPATSIRLSASGGLDRRRRAKSSAATAPTSAGPASPAPGHGTAGADIPATPAAAAPPVSAVSASPSLQIDAAPMTRSDAPAPLPPAGTADSIAALVAESHREFLAGQMALARAILDGKAGGLDPAALALLREVQDSGARLHEQYLRDQTQIARGWLASGQALPGPAPMPGPVPTAATAPMPSPLAAATAPQVPAGPVEPPDTGAASPAQARPGPDPAAATPEQGTPEQVSPEPVAAKPAAGDVGAVLRRIIAEQTGYPEEILEPSLSLEADLGIDSIKRIEIISAAADALGLVRSRSAEAARRAGTLAELAALLHETDAGQGAAAPQPVAASGPPEGANGTPKPGTPILQAEPRALPALPAFERLPGESGVTLILDDGSALAEALVAAVERAGGLPVTLAQVTPAPGAGRSNPAAERHHLVLKSFDAAALDTALQRTAAALGPIRHAILLAPGEGGATEGPVPEGLAQMLALCGALVRLGAAAPRHLLTVTRLDGQLGLTGPAGEWAGALAGLAKTARREVPDLQARAVDLAPDLASGAAAAAILAELGVSGAAEAEVGIAAGVRRTIGLSPWRRTEAAKPLPPVGKTDLILVSGGGRGVTALCARRLAAETGAKLVLLGRTPLDPADPAWAEGASGRELRARASRQLKETGADAAPRAVEAACRAVEAGRALRSTLAAYDGEAAPEYHAVDLGDRDALRRTIADVTARLGPVTGLVHGAGVLADRRIAEIEPGDLARVFGPKVDGFANLMAAVDPASLRRVAAFSSTAAFYGNAGQAVYAMANEALNKACLALARRHPQGRFVAMNWGPWDGGMVDETLARRFAERGMRLLAAEAGAEAFTRMFCDPAPGGYQFVIGDGPDAGAPAAGAEAALEPGAA